MSARGVCVSARGVCVCVCLLGCVCVCVCVCACTCAYSLSFVQLWVYVCFCPHAHLLTQLGPWAVARLAPLFMGFFRQEYTGQSCHFPPPGDLPNPGIELVSLLSPALQADSLPAEPSITLGRLPNHSLGLGLFPQLSSPDDDTTVLLHRL